MDLKRPIQVTQSFMPPLSDVVSFLEGVWERVYLTNNGPLLLELEKRLAEKNNVHEIVSVLNGTIAIELALQALGVQGEVITTPFTFPATSTAICRTGGRPVFVDIDSRTWNIDPVAVEAAITPETQAILAVHVFSRPCDVVRLQEIADKYRLKLIYDAAHANFIQTNGRSIFDWGDCSTTSFHATKLYHTVEGGACFSPNPDTTAKIRQLRFFGYDADKNLTDIGTNAKMTEVSAAVGLANLKYLDIILAKRRALYELYREQLSGCPDLTFQQFDPEEYNYSYFPVLFKDEEQLLNVNAALNAEQIYPRRYFWPLLSDMPAFANAKILGDLHIAKNVSSRILCLPLYPDLGEEDCQKISDLVQAIC
ncbi:MAG: DegT/DnrJ/EryC1/StrS family aminotransferase [Planctomycetia bacterium]|nr:DegT/DnrJ/EryC1/StrS family aminotransferase [Planctomycetia bacterium]